MSARILVVEDEAIVAMDLSHHLNALGYDVVGVASTGEQAVELATDLQPDLVLMDIILKGELDGVEAARRIRAARPIPIVYLTAYADENTLERALETEPLGYLLKPFAERELKITIDMALYKAAMEARLAAEQARYRAVVTQSAEGICLIDASSLRIVEANTAIQNLLGFNQETLAAMSIFDLIDQSPAELKQQLALLTHTGAHMFGMRRLRAQGGRVVEVDLSGSMITSLPQPVILLLARDLSEIRRHEAEVERHRANLAAVIENTADAIWSIDRQYRIITLNTTFQRQFLASFGHSLQAGMNILAHLPESEALEWRNYYDRALTGERFCIERTFAYNDTRSTYEISFNPIRGADAAVTGASIFARDITARKQVEAALRESRRTLQGLLSNLPGMAYRCANDSHWTMEYVSEGCLALTGYSASALLGEGGRSYAEIIHPDDRNRVWEEVQAAVAERRNFQLRYRIVTAQGSEKWVWEQGFAVYDGDRVLALEGLIVDISEQRTAEMALREAKERAEEASRLKDSILANMSHELRTPMTAILGFSELLARRLKDQELANYAQMIYRGGKRLLNLVNSIIDLARIEANKLSLRKQPHPIAETVHHVVDLLAILAERKSLQLHVRVAEDLIVDTDPQREEQVLTNIISNAIRFTDRGDITITARRRRPGEHRAGDIEINVRDTGIGISPEFLPHVFEEFRQESEGLARAYEGSGLGLTIARKLLERMHGEISIESVKNEGTTVTIVLPAAGNKADTQSNDSETTGDLEPMAAAGGGGKRRRILLVEDDVACSTLVRELLGDLHEIIVSETGEDALDRARREHFDAVLMDINLKRGGLDGIATLQRFRESALHAATPVYAMTAYALQGDEKKFLEAGFNGYLAKPFDRKRLCELLRDLTDVHKRQH